jgi:hypothetical protein
VKYLSVFAASQKGLQFEETRASPRGGDDRELKNMTFDSVIGSGAMIGYVAYLILSLRPAAKGEKFRSFFHFTNANLGDWRKAGRSGG